ncbi:hypothetical protein CRENBAI_013050 [Crenichthys baileyi]|uniref:Uncharacterized protein n=1 Tax=Crenichthys baileyi TaxID=28760 RepID=A0AAV9SE63_9TELE
MTVGPSQETDRAGKLVQWCQQQDSELKARYGEEIEIEPSPILLAEMAVFFLSPMTSSAPVSQTSSSDCRVISASSSSRCQAIPTSTSRCRPIHHAAESPEPQPAAEFPGPQFAAKSPQVPEGSVLGPPLIRVPEGFEDGSLLIQDPEGPTDHVPGLLTVLLTVFQDLLTVFQGPLTIAGPEGPLRSAVDLQMAGPEGPLCSEADLHIVGPEGLILFSANYWTPCAVAAGSPDSCSVAAGRPDFCLQTSHFVVSPGHVIDHQTSSSCVAGPLIASILTSGSHVMDMMNF